MEPRPLDVVAWEPPPGGVEVPSPHGAAWRPSEAEEPQGTPGGAARDALAPALPEGGFVQTSARPALLGKPTPPLDLPLPLRVLTEQARRVPEAERSELALRLNTLLAQMAEGGGDRQVADTFHRLLDSEKLEGLVDTQGRSCRAAAVEALLSLGFPYALEVRPEDLEHLRAEGRGAGRTGFGAGSVVPAAVLLAGLVAQLVQELSRAGGPDSLVTTQVGLSTLALMALWLAPPKSAVYRVGLGLLALVTCLGLVVPLLETGPVGTWAILAGLVAVFLAALRES